MKILVPIKRVIDYRVNIRVKSDESGIETQGVKMSMNPFDEIAVEAAIQLKETGHCQEVILVSIGPTSCQETLRTGLAMGADSAIHIAAEQAYEPLLIAKILQQIVEQQQPKLVIMGKQAIDNDSNQTGQMLAGLLDWPQATFTSKINLKDDKLQVEREVDGGLESLMLQLPAVITTDLRLNEPRYVSLPNIMKAKQKPLEILAVESLGVDLKPHIKRIKITAPTAKAKGVKVNSVNELVEKLKLEAKVIE